MGWTRSSAIGVGEGSGLDGESGWPELHRNRVGAEDEDDVDSQRGGGFGYGCFFGAKETSTARKVDTKARRVEHVGRVCMRQWRRVVLGLLCDNDGEARRDEGEI